MTNSVKSNGAARSVERGISLAHRSKDTKQQRAAKAANIYDDVTVYQPTQGELAWIYGISVSLINRAQQLPPEKRQAVAEGRARLPQPKRVLALPKPADQSTGNGKPSDEAVVSNAIAALGVERVLDIASTVEQAAQH